MTPQAGGGAGGTYQGVCFGGSGGAGGAYGRTGSGGGASSASPTFTMYGPGSPGAGGAAGPAVALNGNSVTWLGGFTPLKVVGPVQ